MVETIDHLVLAESRLATQFRETTNLINYIKALLVEANTLEEVFQSIITDRTLDEAYGIQLDILGSIVGQSRELVIAELFVYFGFDGNPQSNSFGTVTDAGVGGRFRGVNESTLGNRKLTDVEYRAFIRAKITRNSTRSTPEDIIALIKFLFGNPLVVLAEVGEARYTISIGRTLSLNEKVLLTETNIIPKTAGVSVSYVTEFDEEDFFSFGGIPGGLGFGSYLNPNLGGTFGTLI